LLINQDYPIDDLYYPYLLMHHLHPLFFTIPAAIIPSLLILWYIYKKDLYPQPPSVVFTTFLLGIFIVLPAVGFEWLASHATGRIGNPHLFGFCDALFVAGIPEEGLKLLVVVLYCMKKSAFAEPMDGLVYGVTASLGFATFENIVHVAFGGMSTAVVRALTSVPAHAMMGLVMGYYLSKSTGPARTRNKYLIFAFVIPVLLHAAYDFPLLTSERIVSLGIRFSGPSIFVFNVLFVIYLRIAFTHAFQLLTRVSRKQEKEASEMLFKDLGEAMDRQRTAAGKPLRQRQENDDE
jgi:RsiW-degrading membrane proteinase PrsW (M82 family)